MDQVKSLLTVRPETETPVSAVSIRRIPRCASPSLNTFLQFLYRVWNIQCSFVGHIPRVPADMPLYDILNEFQKGSSHMAAVVKARGKCKAHPPMIEGEKEEGRKIGGMDTELTTPLLSKQDGKSDHVVVDIPKIPKPTNIKKEVLLHNNVGEANGPHLSEDIEDGEVIGIITLEDVFEELLQVK